MINLYNHITLHSPVTISKQRGGISLFLSLLLKLKHLNKGTFLSSHPPNTLSSSPSKLSNTTLGSSLLKS